MKLFERVVNALGRGARRRPRPGAVVSRRPLDAWREYPADGLTPQKMMAIFREADGGSLSAQLALAEQMEEKDAHLFSVAGTRRLAVTGLPWEVVSAAATPGWVARQRSDRERQLADAAAAHCERTLRELPGFEEALAHLSLAVGRGIAVAELVWRVASGGLRLAEIAPVASERLTLGDDGDLRILTETERIKGIPLPPGKFIVHTPHAASGQFARGGLLRSTAAAFVAKRFAIRDWLIFAEVYGMPVRVARYAPSATDQEKRELLAMVQALGADAAGVFSKAVELEIIQSRSPGETNLYENLCIYFDREISKAWLGQTLTTDTTRMLASAGAAKVHDNVRRDLRDDDLRKEAHTLRRDLLAPITRMQFGPDAPVPHFQRRVELRFEPEKLARVLDTAVNRLGAKVSAKWAHAMLGLPPAAEGDALLSGGPGATATPRGAVKNG